MTTGTKLRHEGDLTDKEYHGVYRHLAEVCERDVEWVTEAGLRGDATVPGCSTLEQLVRMCNVHLESTQHFAWRQISRRISGGTPTPPIEALATLHRILPVLIERRDHYAEVVRLKKTAAKNATAARAAAFRAAAGDEGTMRT